MKTRLAGLIGYPVDHSLSPVFQQAAFNALRLGVRYELWPTPTDEMPERIASLREPRVIGANVTVPHKQRAFDLVDDVSDLARRVGAVNTIVKRGDRLMGDNTDVAGFLYPLRARGIHLDQMRAVVLGAGGAARGVLVGLQLAGCPHIVVANRTLERARGLAQDLDGPVSAAGFGDDLGELLREADLLVNATSVGWHGDALPLDERLLDSLSSSALVYDLTYRQTPLLRFAAKRGNPALDGLEMLVAQGAESFRLWTGQEPPFDLMLATARAATG